MKKKQLVKADKPKENVAKPLCGSYGGSACTGNFSTGEESDILF